MDKLITEAALTLPGAFMTEQWRGAHVFKLGTAKTFKMFAILRPGADRLTIKAPSAETCRVLIEVGVAERHTHLKRGTWISLKLDKMERDDVLERLRASYDVVFPALPKRIRDLLEGV